MCQYLCPITKPIFPSSVVYSANWDCLMEIRQQWTIETLFDSTTSSRPICCIIRHPTSRRQTGRVMSDHHFSLYSFMCAFYRCFSNGLCYYGAIYATLKLNFVCQAKISNVCVFLLFLNSSIPCFDLLLVIRSVLVFVCFYVWVHRHAPWITCVTGVHKHMQSHRLHLYLKVVEMCVLSWMCTYMCANTRM